MNGGEPRVKWRSTADFGNFTTVTVSSPSPSRARPSDSVRQVPIAAGFAAVPVATWTVRVAGSKSMAWALMPFWYTADSDCRIHAASP